MHNQVQDFQSWGIRIAVALVIASINMLLKVSPRGLQSHNMFDSD